MSRWLPAVKLGGPSVEEVVVVVTHKSLAFILVAAKPAELGIVASLKFTLNENGNVDLSFLMNNLIGLLLTQY